MSNLLLRASKTSYLSAALHYRSCNPLYKSNYSLARNKNKGNADVMEKHNYCIVSQSTFKQYFVFIPATTCNSDLYTTWYLFLEEIASQLIFGLSLKFLTISTLITNLITPFFWNWSDNKFLFIDYRNEARHLLVWRVVQKNSFLSRVWILPALSFLVVSLKDILLLWKLLAV